MPTWKTRSAPSRTVKVRMLYRRSPSMSGTSLRTAIAKLNGSTNRHSAHTGG